MTRNDDGFSNRSEAFESFDDIPLSPRLSPTIGEIICRRYSRREAMRGALAVTAATALFGGAAMGAARTPDRFAFDELVSGCDETHHIAEGYRADILLRWGDPVFADAPAFDPMNQSEASQLRQFGYNNDYVGFLPLGEGRGLLCVNHEYTNEEVMFPGTGRQDRKGFAGMTPELAAIEMAAHGGTVIEIARGADGRWTPVLGSPYNRRITASRTEMAIDGPAAGHPRMRTTADPGGTRVVGTLNNCAGGITPWGTWLMAEENFHGYFWTDAPDAQRPAAMRRYGVPGRFYAWGRHHDRFNVDREPNEPNRFGWIVEVDPLDPASTPVKHTAMGRFRHEGAETTLAKDGRAVVYSGDDARFDYVYKFVSAGPVSGDRAADMRLLGQGTLYVARFNEDGTLDWLPLVHGQGPLTPENGFADQADVLIDTRLAADAVGATPMDRPEDVQPKGDGTVFVMLTNNAKRRPREVNAANPRPDNAFGHVIEIREAGGDHGAMRGVWDIVVKCGDPRIAEVGAEWHPDTSEHGWFASPDNCAIDADGRLWIATDQGTGWIKSGKSDGLYSLETEGERRGHAKLFFRCPVGAELCGPCFADEGRVLFLAVQHPGTDGTRDYPGFARDSTFEDPATRWPDFQPGMPPRPSVLVVTRADGGKIAG